MRLVNSDPAARERSRQRSRQRWVANLFALTALAGWWVYSQFVPVYQLPGPDLVAWRMLEFVTSVQLRSHLLFSLGHALSSVALAFLIGLLLAITAHNIWLVRGFIDERLTPFLNSFSGIGWLFLAILWFGIDSTTVIFSVTMILIPFIIINIRTGLIELDREIGELGRSLTRQPLLLFTKITFPMLIPYLFAALRTSFGVAWKVVLTAELFGGSNGVGYLLNLARQQFDTETIFAVIGFIILFVYTSEVLFFSPIQKRLARRYSRD